MPRRVVVSAGLVAILTQREATKEHDVFSRHGLTLPVELRHVDAILVVVDAATRLRGGRRASTRRVDRHGNRSTLGAGDEVDAVLAGGTAARPRTLAGGNVVPRERASHGFTS